MTVIPFGYPAELKTNRKNNRKPLQKIVEDFKNVKMR